MESILGRQVRLLAYPPGQTGLYGADSPDRPVGRFDAACADFPGRLTFQRQLKKFIGAERDVSCAATGPDRSIRHREK